MGQRMNTWAPLWNGLVDSSIWEEPDHVFRVFMAMMSLKDADHVVRPFDAYKFARRIHMEVEKVLDALKVLAGPDSRRPGQEFEGRRIKAVEEGWLILNGEKYRELMRIEMKRAKNRRAQSKYRERHKDKPMTGETAHERIFRERGAEAADEYINSLSRETKE